jgi:hypothetical protein
MSKCELPGGTAKVSSAMVEGEEWNTSEHRAQQEAEERGEQERKQEENFECRHIV